jgi:hypothetical protein
MQRSAVLRWLQRRRRWRRQRRRWRWRKNLNALKIFPKSGRFLTCDTARPVGVPILTSEPEIGFQTQRSFKHIINGFNAAARHSAAAPRRLRRARPRRLQAGFRADAGQTSESPGSAGFHGQLSIMATSQPHRKQGKGQRRDDIRGSTLAPHTHCSQATRAQRIPRG